jgi:hypothetical protein
MFGPCPTVVFPDDRRSELETGQNDLVTAIVIGVTDIDREDVGGIIILGPD